MRIVYLANSRWPTIRGAERLLLSLLEYGRSRGHEVSVIAPQSSAIHRACRDRGVRSDAAEFGFAPTHIARLRALLRALHPDIVHGMSIYPVAYLRRLRLLSASTRCFAYVSTDPTSTLPIAASNFRRTLLLARNAISRREAPRLEAIFVPSRTVAERLGSANIQGRTVVTSGVIDPAKLTADATSPLPLPPGAPRIGYAGYLEKLKGIDNLITAFVEVSRDHPDAVLLVAGDGPERGSLGALADSLGVGARVALFGHLEPVAPLLAALDVFVSPSHSEALGRSILEAMALGVPCVCTASGGPAEIVHDAENGLLVPPDDPGAIAAAVSRLLDDPEFASRIGTAGRATALSEPYLLSTTLETILAEYERTAAFSASEA